MSETTRPAFNYSYIDKSKDAEHVTEQKNIIIKIYTDFLEKLKHVYENPRKKLSHQAPSKDLSTPEENIYFEDLDGIARDEAFISNHK